jgi:quinol-cytochrome oxidoreductase complex cytochrome b subunit
MANRQDRERGARWYEKFWADVVASIDASLLAFPRFLGLLYGRIDRSLPINESYRKAMTYRLQPHAGWRHALGGITYLLFMILVVTGVLLSFYYRPSVEEAYASTRYIVSEVPLGWLVRDLHVWSASLIVFFALAHMARVFFAAAYKPPRETNWLVGYLLLLIVVLFGATGYLLPWDQWSYWTVTEAMGAVQSVPIIGGFAAGSLMGDVLVSGATLSRFYAVHVIVLPWVTLGLVMLHFSLIRKHGIAPPGRDLPTPGKGMPFAHHLLRTFMAGILTFAVVISLAALFPRSMGDPANPYVIPEDLVSSWVVVDVTLAVIRYAGAVGLVIFTLLGIGIAFLPLFDRKPERQLRKRPVALAFGIIYFVGFAVALIVGRQLHTVPPPDTLEIRALEERVLPAGPEFPQEDGRAEETPAAAGDSVETER